MLALTLRFWRKGQCRSGMVLPPEGDEIDKFDELAHKGDEERPIKEEVVYCKDGDQDATKPESKHICHAIGVAGSFGDAQPKTVSGGDPSRRRRRPCVQRSPIRCHTKQGHARYDRQPLWFDQEQRCWIRLYG